MNLVIRGALILAGAVTLWSIALYGLDVHLNAALFRRIAMPPTFALTVVIVYLTLRKSAAIQVYRQQVASGALLGAIAGMLIAATTWLTLTVLFPAASAESNEAMVALVREQQATQAQIAAAESFYETWTPFRKATFGAWMILFTSIVSSAVTAIWNRRAS